MSENWYRRFYQRGRKETCERILSQLNNKFRVVQNDEDLEWNRCLYMAIEVVKEEGGLNDE